MKTLLIKNTWLPTIDCGWGNGYVVIPKGHKLNGIEYTEEPLINVEVHGGLTFSERAKNCNFDADFDPEDWVIGFDTAHYGDTQQNWPKEAVRAELEDLKKQIEKLS